MSADLELPPCLHGTTTERYITFFYALNLRLPDEDTGDWHFLAESYRSGEVSMAGPGECVNTMPALGELGVRNMAKVLACHGIGDGCEAIFAANHYRAIADMAAEDFLTGGEAKRVTPREINSWLDTEDQIEVLRDKYLAPLMPLFDPYQGEAFARWLITVRYQ
jgi:hypothetical protein